MNETAAPAAPAQSLAAPTAPTTRLSGRWLWLARVGWLAVVLFTLALALGSLPTYYHFLQQPCVGTLACNLNGALDATGARALHAAGFSLRDYATYTLILTLAGALIWAAVGLVIFWRRSDEWVALLVAFTLCMNAFSNGSGQDGVFGVLAFVSPVWTLPAQVITFLYTAAGFLAFGLFPQGRFAPRWVGWVLIASILVQGLAIFPPAASPLNSNTWPGSIANVLGISTFVAVIYSQIYRYRRLSTPVQRQQIKWAVFGIVLTALLWMGIIVLQSVVPLNQANALLEVVNNTLWLVTSLPIPIFVGLAILRSRLWDIDTIINKTLVYGSLTALLGALYAGLIIGLESLAGVISNQAANNPVVLVVSTLAIAALFYPLRRRIQGLIDRRFYRKKYDAEKMLAVFSAALRNETDLEQLRGQLLAVVEETMQPAHVSLWLRQPERLAGEQVHRWEQPGYTPNQTREN
ncbi:MAG TPA: hypothetical protein VKT82_25070 [Ktedonobacterales bacterium]|nr:hypothetical protein [Ktedonobacterales bacterium]